MSPLVNRVGLTAYQPFPVYPYEQTSSASVGMSQTCQNQTFQGYAFNPGYFATPRRAKVAAVDFQQLIGSYAGSVSLAAQEGRDIVNGLLDRIAHSEEAAVRIEAPRSRLARIFRNQRFRQPFGVAGRRGA